MNKYKLKKELILESLSYKIRRRVSFHQLKDELDYSVLENMDPCQFWSAGEFISEACDNLKDIIIESALLDDFHLRIVPKDNDDLYYYLVHTFESYLLEHYRKMCKPSH